ncbi:receptor-like protein kinase [Gossypium australe]|uniref:Receptor-like protein kinase n=1 Tax=Gossypium australe TaxID=47621 RepID=A0A5B6VWS9_9ROSI|nr:receptor-like protein kinase [Gossypium australe]
MCSTYPSEEITIESKPYSTVESLEVEPNLSHEEEPIHILAKEVKELRNKIIPLVKVLWRNHSMEKATWERKSLMKEQYPQHLQRKDEIGEPSVKCLAGILLGFDNMPFFKMPHWNSPFGEF